MSAQTLSRVWLSVTPWTVAHQAPLSWNSPGKNTGVGGRSLPRVEPHSLPDPGGK